MIFKKIHTVLFIILFVAIAVLYVLHFKGRSRIAFVRSSELVYGYKGMKEAQKEQELKTQQIKNNFDTLQMDLQRSVSAFNASYAKLSKTERLEKENLLKSQDQNLRHYSEASAKNLKEADHKITEGILNQINTYVEAYGKEHGYTMIFGTTSSGNILYGEDKDDITKMLLEELNKNYKTPSQTGL